MQLFPKVESTEPHKKLKPMTIDDEAVFNEYISKLEAPFPLMFRLAKATGLRIYELATFPAEGIGELEPDDLSVVNFPISPENGCHTKYGKPRTLEIPTEMYNKLEVYFHSDERAMWLKKREEKYKKAVEDGSPLDEFEHEPLFMSNRGMVYDRNTLECQFWDLRDEIRIHYPNWYYRPHDLRSTFGTKWLFSNAQYRGVSYDFLMDELADIMGHSSTSTTEKYTKFAKKKDSQIYVAKKKNNRIQKGGK
jgi:integrase